MTDHLPECECYGRNHGECALCICVPLRACEQRVRLGMALTHEREWIEARDAGYEAGLKAAHEDPNILASYSWSQGYAAALDAAREAVRHALGPMESTDPGQRDAALAAINALREEAK